MDRGLSLCELVSCKDPCEDPFTMTPGCPSKQGMGQVQRPQKKTTLHPITLWIQ